MVSLAALLKYPKYVVVGAAGAAGMAPCPGCAIVLM